VPQADIRRLRFAPYAQNPIWVSWHERERFGGLKLVHGVLVDLPVLHNEIEILGGVSHEVEILQWVTVNQEKVRQCAFLNDPELAWIWIAET
jgi:hypothetical protein